MVEATTSGLPSGFNALTFGQQTANGGWAGPAQLFCDWQTAPGATQLSLNITNLSISGTVNQGWELVIIDETHSGQILDAQVQPAGASVPFSEAWLVNIPAGCLRITFHAGVWNAPSNTGTVQFQFACGWK